MPDFFSIGTPDPNARTAIILAIVYLMVQKTKPLVPWEESWRIYPWLAAVYGLVVAYLAAAIFPNTPYSPEQWAFNGFLTGLAASGVRDGWNASKGLAESVRAGRARAAAPRLEG
ncbi:MAG: hypothetical protein U0556_09795 [Dehalococcoidia bacterium]